MIKSQKLTTRSLMACVVLGGASAVFVWISVMLNGVLAGSVPWLAYVAPLPFFWGVIAAVLLIRRPGVATLTGIVAAIIGFGGVMALLAALLIELVAFVGKGLLDGTGPLFGRSALIWAVCAGFVGGLSQGMGIFMVSAARDALPWNLILLGVIVKILLGGVYGFLTFLVARVIYRSGVNPQGLPARV